MASLKDLFPQQLHTPRLILDLFDAGNDEHYVCMLATMNSATAHARMGDFGVRTPAELDAFNASARLHDRRFRHGVADGEALYMLRERDDAAAAAAAAAGNVWIGAVSLAQRVVCEGTVVLPPDIGWGLCEGYMGRGYATEAATELLRFAREDFKVEKGVIVFPSEKNQQSNRVAEKLGFVPGGVCKDLDNPGMLMSIWISPGMEKMDEILKDGISFHMK